MIWRRMAKARTALAKAATNNNTIKASNVTFSAPTETECRVICMMRRAINEKLRNNVVPSAFKNNTGRDCQLREVLQRGFMRRISDITHFLPLLLAVMVMLPAASWAVLGDNAAWSHDSRMIGYVPAERLLGIMIRPLNDRRDIRD